MYVYTCTCTLYMCIMYLACTLYMYVHVHTCTCTYMYRLNTKVQTFFPALLGVISLGKRFEPLFVCYAFEAKLLPSKLRCHTHFNICTCALL